MSGSVDSNSKSQSVIGRGFWALLSGTLGAAASCFAKGAFSKCSTAWFDTAVNQSAAIACPSLEEWSTCFRTIQCGWEWLICHGLSFVLPRLLCIIAMVACNAAMVACFVGGLQDAGSIAGTALATAANFIVSAVTGYFVWNEGSHLSVPGLAMVVVGTLVLVMAQAPPNASTNENAAPIFASKRDHGAPVKIY